MRSWRWWAAATAPAEPRGTALHKVNCTSQLHDQESDSSHGPPTNGPHNRQTAPHPTTTFRLQVACPVSPPREPCPPPSCVLFSGHETRAVGPRFGTSPKRLNICWGKRGGGKGELGAETSSGSLSRDMERSCLRKRPCPGQSESQHS